MAKDKKIKISEKVLNQLYERLDKLEQISGVNKKETPRNESSEERLAEYEDFGQGDYNRYTPEGVLPMRLDEYQALLRGENINKQPVSSKRGQGDELPSNPSNVHIKSQDIGYYQPKELGVSYSEDYGNQNNVPMYETIDDGKKDGVPMRVLLDNNQDIDEPEVMKFKGDDIYLSSNRRGHPDIDELVNDREVIKHEAQKAVAEILGGNLSGSVDEAANNIQPDDEYLNFLRSKQLPAEDESMAEIDAMLENYARRKQ